MEPRQLLHMIVTGSLHACDNLSLMLTLPQEGFVHLAQHGRLTLDSKKIKGDLETFLAKENRFSSLTRKNPEASARLHHHLQVITAPVSGAF